MLNFAGLFRKRLCLALMLNFILLLQGFAFAAGENIEIKFLTQNKKVIPLSFSEGGFWFTNIKLPDIVVSNNGKDTVKLSGMLITGKINGMEAVTYNIPPQLLSGSIAMMNLSLKKVKDSPVKLESLKIRYGKMAVPLDKLGDDEEIKPGLSVVVPLSGILYFDYTGTAKIDELEMTLFFKKGAKENKIVFPVKLTYYQTKGKYIYPFKGDLFLINLPMNLLAHRPCLSQEFAFDAITVKQSKDGALVPFDYKEGQKPKLTDYYCYNSNIMAVGDGFVVAAKDKFPESAMSDPQSYSEEYFVKLMEKLIPEIGFDNAALGNYVIIDHENGEYSVYCHLKELSVKNGDKVKQKQVIGKLGNTGHSTIPHLHFQIMDSPDFLAANSLPISFTDFPCAGEGALFRTANSFIFSDYIYTNLK